MAQAIVQFIQSQQGVSIQSVLALLQPHTDKILVFDYADDSIHAYTMQAWMAIWKDEEVGVDHPKPDDAHPQWVVMNDNTSMEMVVFRKDAVTAVTR